MPVKYRDIFVKMLMSFNIFFDLHIDTCKQVIHQLTNIISVKCVAFPLIVALTESVKVYNKY